MLLYYLYLAPLLLLPYVAAAILPSWRWMLTNLLIGATLLSLGIWLLPVRPPPDSYRAGEGSVYAVILSGGIILVYLCGLIARLVTLIFRWRLFPALILHAVVFALLVSAPHLYHQASQPYRMWPPSEACRAATFKVGIADLSLEMPSSPLFTIWPGSPDTGDVFSLTEPVHHRKFCTEYENGRLPVKATRLSAHFLLFPWPMKYCANPPAWARPICVREQNPALRAFPTEARIMSSDGFQKGQWRSTEEESRGSASRNFFIKSDLSTPDGRPLTFSCSISSMRQDTAYCHAAYLWRDGAYLAYEFFTPKTEVADHGRRHDAAARQLFEGFLKPK